MSTLTPLQYSELVILISKLEQSTPAQLKVLSQNAMVASMDTERDKSRRRLWGSTGKWLGQLGREA